MVKRSWVVINLNTLINNLETFKQTGRYRPDEIMLVVKANAYGHGDVEVAKVALNYGIRNFAVSNIAEACKLRENGIDGQILILGYTPIENASLLVEYDITQALISEQYANELIKTGLPIKCQYAIDTGMNRIGLDADNITKCRKAICSAATKLNLNGVFTHLCVADTDNDECNAFTNAQIIKFKKIADSIRDLNLKYVHCLNSAGGLWHKTEISSLVRLGIILYGLKPDYLNTLPKEIQTVLEWKSAISMIKTVMPGETVGYGRTFMAEREMRIATIPTGYADGYSRALSNTGYVLIHGQRAPIVGRICMDQFMVDVSKITEAKPFDEVTLIGKNGDQEITADDMANWIGTIGYEIVCSISSRVERIYIGLQG